MVLNRSTSSLRRQSRPRSRGAINLQPNRSEPQHKFRLHGVHFQQLSSLRQHQLCRLRRHASSTYGGRHDRHHSARLWHGRQRDAASRRRATSSNGERWAAMELSNRQRQERALTPDPEPKLRHPAQPILVPNILDQLRERSLQPLHQRASDRGHASGVRQRQWRSKHG